MKYNHHKIDNFPKDASTWHKVKANVLFALGITKMTWRKPHLTRKDRRRARKIVRRGDIILVGAHRRLSSLAVHGVVTHSLLYIGKKRVIHAAGDGVEKADYRYLFKEYDTMIILRPRAAKQKDIQGAIDFAESQIGKPFDYDFEFEQESKKLFCSELVNKSYLAAGFETGFSDERRSVRDYLITPHHPSRFLEANFDVVFFSHSVIFKDGAYVLNPKIYNNKIVEYIQNE